MKSIKNIIKKIIDAIAYIGLSFNFPFLTFIKLIVFTRKVYTANSKKKILFLYKSGGMEDIYSTYYKKNPHFEIYVLPRKHIKFIFKYFFKSQQNNEILTKFNVDLELIKKRKLYENFLTKILKYYKLILNITIISNFSFFNFEHWDLAIAAKKNKIKFVTLHKECLKSKGKRLVDLEIYKKYINKYQGDKIIVYNEDEKNIMASSKIIDKKNIYVTGCARLDYCFEFKRSKNLNSRLNVVYYAIQHDVSLPYFNGEFINISEYKLAPYTWNDNLVMFENIFFDYLKQNSNFNLIIKTKTGNLDQVERLKKFEKFNNVKIVNAGTGGYLLKSADLCIAFNSTIIYEAMASLVPVFIPKFDIQKEYESFLFDFTNTTNVFDLNDRQQFFRLFDNFLNKKIKFDEKISENNIKELDLIVGNSDGKSGIRLKEFFENIL
jgi:hypothetical protein